MLVILLRENIQNDFKLYRISTLFLLKFLQFKECNRVIKYNNLFQTKTKTFVIFVLC